MPRHGQALPSVQVHGQRAETQFYRLVLRQGTSESRYIEGTCRFSEKEGNASYLEWALFPAKDERWKQYNLAYETPHLRMGLKAIRSLGFDKTHSNFEYYDDGGFKNNEPFDDLPELMRMVTGRAKLLKSLANKQKHTE